MELESHPKPSLEEAEQEFDELLREASGEVIPAQGLVPTCVSCDSVIIDRQPRRACRSCHKPLCADCDYRVMKEGHARQCPACELLERFAHRVPGERDR